MTSTSDVLDEAERIIRQLTTALTAPREGECLCCYVARMLEEFSCDGTHRLALHWRDARAPRATSLLKRLSRMGACCCDCEMFLNAYQLVGASDQVDDEDLEAETVELPLPPCAGVRRGSVQPCGHWERIRRW